MKRSTLLRKETVIPAFAVSLILAFAFVMPGNAFRNNGDEQCGYGYGYGQNDNEDQQGDQNDKQQGDNNDQGCEVDNENDNEIGNTSGDDNLSGSGDKEDAQGETGGTHVASLTKTAGEKHSSAPAAKPAVVKSGDHEGDGDQGGSGSGGDGGGGGEGGD